MVLSSLDLTGRRALVCGASSGLGRAVALALAARGANVVVLARRGDLLRALVEELRDAGAPEASAVVADLDDRDDLGAQVAGLDVQILVNNTGGPPGGLLMEEDPAKLAFHFGRHVLSAQVLLRATLPSMRAAGYGRIVNILSTSVREPIPNLGVSNTIRGAMASWAKTLSHELPPGITINNVLPGYHDTGRLTELKAGIAARTGQSEDAVHAAWLASVPEGRLGEPEELATLVAHLVSPAGAYIRGQSIAIDGGRSRSI